MNLFYNIELDKNDKNKKDIEPFVLEIDNSDKNIIHYKDPNYSNGYYTLSNIQPNKIKVLE
jgi:hypothetical protein